VNVFDIEFFMIVARH